MKLLLFILLAIAPISANALTNKELAAQISAKAKQQQEILDQTLKQLSDSRETVNTLWTELSTAQTQIAKVDKERQGWHDYADDQHDRWINAEKRVSDEKVKVLRRNILIIGMTLLIAGYAVAKFYLHLPI